MNREEFFLMFEQLIKENETFLNNKLKLYRDYCLSLGKEYLDSVIPGLYEKVKNINIINNKMEDLEKQFITSSQSNLVQEAKKICENILVMIGEQDEMLMDKAKVFCKYFLNHKPDGVETTELEKRCVKYIENLDNFHYYKLTFKNNTIKKESLFDMEGKRIKNI